MSYCSECTYFRDDGFCRAPMAKGKSDVGYFQKACNCFVKRLEETNMAEVKKRICAECGKELPEDQFARNARGITKYCKDCMTKKIADGKAAKPEIALSSYTDNDLAEELKRRGYTGKLTRINELEL